MICYSYQFTLSVLSNSQALLTSQQHFNLHFEVTKQSKGALRGCNLPLLVFLYTPISISLFLHSQYLYSALLRHFL
ncbi:hypothetical protein CC80DRAFT_160696 [Byssothecium circinans]|uniref:Uncharacterized protein n=1 Tax=Byssothecium circinans TaxID=147558 RepID=A0A6A5UCK2_9PLEO|nr:hypothetical protein CC80DRAFT_160696 [Byssothecium circinans]